MMVWKHFRVHVRVDFVMLQKLAIGFRPRNDACKDQRSRSLFHGTSHRLAYEPHWDPQVEWKIFIQPRLHKARTWVVDDDFGGRQCSQAANIGINNSFGISVTKEFAKSSFIIKVAEYRAIRRYRLFG